MNLSGVAVRDLVRKYKIKREDLLVVCDCMDLEFGRLKIRPGGSAAGQRGLQSIIDALGSPDFARLRIGIGRPGKFTDPAEYVLTAFNKKERSELKEVLQKAASCCVSWATEGITGTMNTYNVVPRLNA
jgi:PTH1 family peptidyl-tRNA hydrolase